MRYFCSGMPCPSEWMESDLPDEQAVIGRYVDERMRVHDADECGSKTVFFAFSTGRHFRVTYSWWIDYDPEWTLHDSVEFEEVDASETRGLCADRDWMRISRHAYPDPMQSPAWKALVERGMETMPATGASAHG